ncbi:MAG: AAA family ATPase, partial [Chlamydiae bacterium]|nr:AAA family ATPase [Chlamydiota bacterium]
MEIKRRAFNQLQHEISEPEISVLLGARQVGKSTLLKQLEKEAKGKGYSTQFYNLELASDLEKLAGNEKEIFEKLSSAAQIVFIDEFHYLKNAFKIFKAIYDSNSKVKIFASGSSSIEIHKHLKESLVGRFKKTMIYPLSFEELQQIPSFKLETYCQWGGMPGLIHRNSLPSKAELLDNIVSTYLTKDIKALIQEENVRAFNSLLYMLAQNQGSLGVVANLAREIGISESTVARH